MPKKYTPVEILGKSLHTALPTLLAPLPNPHITQHSMPVIVAKTAKASYLAFFLHLLDLTLQLMSSLLTSGANFEARLWF